MATCVDADIISSKRGPFVTINKVRWPVYDWEVANKLYVDTVVGNPYTYESPLHIDNVNLKIYVDDAASGMAGVVSTGSQYFTGTKTFSDINVVNTIPSSANSVITAGYLTTVMSNVVYETPLSSSGTLPMTVTINNASGTLPGVISGTAQTLGGNLTFTGNTVQIGDETVSGTVLQTGSLTVSGVSSFINTATALTQSITVADNQIATGSLVRTATLGEGFDGCSGWISGCVLSLVDQHTFSVGSGSFRFTDYTNESFPICGPVMSHADWGNFTVPSVYASYPSFEIGIYIENTVNGPIINTQGGASNVQLMYGQYIEIGAAVLSYGNIISIVNGKAPFGDRSNLTSIEFASLLSPINLGPNKVQAGQTDLGDLTLQMMAGGSMWEYGANATNNPTNRNTISLPAWQSTTLPMIMIWQDNNQMLQSNGTSTSLDTTQYNPGAAGTQTVVIATTSDYYVNIPILYNPSANIWMMQYPTELWSSLAQAQANSHSFVRMWGGGTMTLFVVMAIISVKAYATDLTAAVISSGEYFNYAVGGASGSTGGGGGAGTLNSVTEGYTASVGANPYYSSTGGAMNNFASAFSSYSNAISAAIPEANYTTPCLVHVSAGLQQEANNLTLKPHVSIAGWAHGSTRYKLGSGGNIVVDGAFATQTSNGSDVTIRNMRMVDGAGVNINLWTLTGTSSQLNTVFDFYDFECDGTFSFDGRPFLLPAATSGDVCRMTYCMLNSNASLVASSTLNGGVFLLNNVCYPYSGSTLVFRADHCQTDATIIACLLQNVTVLLTGAYDINLLMSSNYLQDGGILTLVNSGTGTINVQIDRASLPFPTTTRISKTGSNIVFNVYDEEESEENLIYMAAVGNDGRSGQNLNNSVLTLSAAVNLCTGASSSNPYVIHCADAEVLPALTDSATLPPFVSFNGANVNLEGNITMAEGCVVEVGTMLGNVTMQAQTSTATSCVRMVSGTISAIVATGSVSNHWYVDFAELSVTGLTCGGNNTVYLMGGALTGGINAVGNSAIIDVTKVGNLQNATFSTASGGTIRFPPNYGTLPGTANGIVKNIGNGTLTVASAGTDYLVGTQNVVLNPGVAVVLNATTGSVATMIAGAATTTDSSTEVSILSYNASTIGSANALSVTYSIVCTSSVAGSYGQFTGSFRAFCTAGGTVSVTTPFSTAMVSLDAGVNKCTVTAVGNVPSNGYVTIQVTGQGVGTTVLWTGEMTITQQVI
jgi:hypothetical protein